MKCKKFYFLVFMLLNLFGCSNRVDIPIILPALSGQSFSSIYIQSFSSSNDNAAIALKDRIIMELNHHGFIKVTGDWAQATLTGNFELSINETQCESSIGKDKNGNNHQIYICNRSALSRVSYRLTDLSGIVVVNQFSKSHYSVEISNTSVEHAVANLQRSGEFWQEAIEEFAQKIVADISPRMVKKSWPLQDGKITELKEAIKLFNENKIEQARTLWNDILFQDKNPEDEAVAEFNLGVLAMSRLDRETAWHHLDRAINLQPNNSLYQEKIAKIADQIRLVGDRVPTSTKSPKSPPEPAPKPAPNPAPAPTPEPTPEPAPPVEILNAKYYAIVIGINQYNNDSIWKLDTPVADAKAVAEILQIQYGFTVKLLLDYDATRTNIIDTIKEIAEKLDENAQLLIYYAGHGWFDEKTKHYFWQPVDATEKESSWIQTSSITGAARASRANNILIVADSCYAATMTRSIKTYNYAGIIAGFKRKSRILISSGANQPVTDDGLEGHSIFAYAFLNGLKNMSATYFTAHQLYFEYIKETVAGHTKDQIPQYQFIQDSGHDYGDFVFLRK